MMENEASRVSNEPAAPVDRHERWRLLLEEQRQSGMSISAFCKERSIPASAFFAWRRKLAATGGSVTNRRSRRAGSEGLAEVKLVRDSPPQAGLELRLAGGCILVVRRGFDRDLLIELIGVLESSPSALERPA